MSPSRDIYMAVFRLPTHIAHDMSVACVQNTTSSVESPLFVDCDAVVDVKPCLSTQFWGRQCLRIHPSVATYSLAFIGAQCISHTQQTLAASACFFTDTIYGGSYLECTCHSDARWYAHHASKHFPDVVPDGFSVFVSHRRSECRHKLAYSLRHYSDFE